MKKKPCDDTCSPEREKKQVFLTRARYVFLCVLMCFTSLSLMAQEKEKKFDVSFENESLETVLTSLKKQCGYDFIYQKEAVAGVKVDRLEMKQATLKQILDKLLLPLGFSYEIVDRSVVIKKRDEKSKETLVQSITIRGKVIDIKKHPLPGVTVLVKGTALGVSTSTDGSFKLEIPNKDVVLVFSFVGMESKEVKLNELKVSETSSCQSLEASINIKSEILSNIPPVNDVNIVELQKDIEKKIQIDEMRKEFLSNVSHELKTPIALIQGYAEGLQECINDDPESREFYCDVIIDEAGKMNNMVKKLLSLNQLEFGNDQVTMERFNITELIRGVVQSSQLLASQKEADLRFVQKNPVYVWGDEFKIEEVITNYVSNALNHVDYDKKIEVKIIQKGKLIRVSVFNTGEPIPQEDLDKIWIKFYKVDKARTREYGGSGIGLSIVKAIMDSMNQKCGVINYDNGVEFWFELQSADPAEISIFPS